MEWYTWRKTFMFLIIQEQILQENHKPADVEHPEQQRILKLIKRNYW